MISEKAVKNMGVKVSRYLRRSFTAPAATHQPITHACVPILRKEPRPVGAAVWALDEADALQQRINKIEGYRQAQGV